MRAPDIVQARASGHEPFRLGVIFAVYQSHEFRHRVAMEPGWTEGVLRHQPRRGANATKSTLAVPAVSEEKSEPCKSTGRDDRTYRSDHREFPQVVLVRRQVPCHATATSNGEESVSSAQKFPANFATIWCGSLLFSNAAVGAKSREFAEPVSIRSAPAPAAGTSPRNSRKRPARCAVWRFDPKRMPRGITVDFHAWNHVQHAQLGHQPKGPLLRHDQHLAVRVVKHFSNHGTIGPVNVRGHAAIHARIAVAADGDQPFTEIRRRRWNGKRTPPHLKSRRRREVIERSALQQPVVDLLKRPIVQPRDEFDTPTCAGSQPSPRSSGKRRARQQLRIQSHAGTC